MPPFTPRGYADGKRAAEKAARELVDDSFGAAVLKPGGARACPLHLRATNRCDAFPS
jgi:hypothetical protein